MFLKYGPQQPPLPCAHRGPDQLWQDAVPRAPALWPFLWQIRFRRAHLSDICIQQDAVPLRQERPAAVCHHLRAAPGRSMAQSGADPAALQHREAVARERGRDRAVLHAIGEDHEGDL